MYEMYFMCIPFTVICIHFYSCFPFTSSLVWKVLFNLLSSFLGFIGIELCLWINIQQNIKLQDKLLCSIIVFYCSYVLIQLKVLWPVLNFVNLFDVCRIFIHFQYSFLHFYWINFYCNLYSFLQLFPFISSFVCFLLF